MFKKNIVVGVSVHPEAGLEVAQIDFANKVVLKYGSKELGYDNARREIADLDIFKESLSELLHELDIPKGSLLALSLPAVCFNVVDYPASLSPSEVETAIEEELMNHPIFQNNESCISAVKLPNSTLQISKVSYVATQKTQLIEIAMIINDLGYKIQSVDTSVNTTLNALIYNARVNTTPDASWVMLLVDNNICRIIPMQGRTYVDCFEERISIGEVLGDAENYSTVLNAVAPILKNLPSQYLYVVSRTNIISAEALAQKIEYPGQVIHQEANSYAKTAFLELASTVDESYAKRISLDVIGAAISKDFEEVSAARFNLYNESLGDVYTVNQPLVIKFGSLEFVATLEKMLVLTVVFAAVIYAGIFAGQAYYQDIIDKNTEEKNSIEQKIQEYNKFLQDNKNISSELFDEGYEIKLGLVHNKKVYSYYTIVGTEIPKKVWLTSLELGRNVTIDGQADNLPSIYGFLRNLKDYDPKSEISIKKLALASENPVTVLSDEESFDTEAILTSMDADYYEFTISDGDVAPVETKKSVPTDDLDIPLEN